MTLNELFPEIEPFNEGRLQVSNLHELYYEQSGNPDGKPVVFLHGGPGSGTKPSQRRFFDPEFYRIILFDQRGTGKSTPFAGLRDNTTWDLVSDMEKLRAHLGVEKWLVFGGSWGSTLSFAYAMRHPAQVQAMILRGIFLCRQSEIDWFYEQGGAHQIFPDEWEKYLAPIPNVPPGKMVESYYKLLTGDDEDRKLQAAAAWSTWEGATSKLERDQGMVGGYADPKFALPFARIECHYFMNSAFMPPSEQLLQEIAALKHIPTRIVQGQYDIVCPMKTAFEVKKTLQLPNEEFRVVTTGHHWTEPLIRSELVQASEDFKRYF